ncbi:MAG: peptidase M48, partial [Rhodobacterales bacterium]
MLRFTPILLALLYGVIMYRFSVWRTNRELASQSNELVDPHLGALTDRMAAALELEKIRVHLYEIDPVNALAAPDGKIY